MKNKHRIFATIVCALPVLAGIVLYPQLPEQIAIHWDFNGEVNGYSSKFVGAIVFPGILLVIHLLFPFLLRTDPKYKNMSKRLIQVIDWTIPIVAVLASSSTLGAAFGWNMHIESVMPAFIGLLFVILGNYLPKTKQSYTMGIKLPWTLHSEENWNATHRMAGYLWVAGGILMMVCSLFPALLIFFPAVIIVMVAVPTVYSYLFYRKETKEN